MGEMMFVLKQWDGSILTQQAFKGWISALRQYKGREKTSKANGETWAGQIVYVQHDGKADHIYGAKL